MKPYKKYKYIVTMLKKLNISDKDIENILSLVNNLEIEAWRRGAREGFSR